MEFVFRDVVLAPPPPLHLLHLTYSTSTSPCLLSAHLHMPLPPLHPSPPILLITDTSLHPSTSSSPPPHPPSAPPPHLQFHIPPSISPYIPLTAPPQCQQPLSQNLPPAHLTSPNPASLPSASRPSMYPAVCRAPRLHE